MQPDAPPGRRRGMSLSRSALVALFAAAVTAAGLPAPATLQVATPATAPAARIEDATPVVAAPPPLTSAPAPAPKVAPAPKPAPPRDTRRGTPYFATPRAAMRYLVWAYNGHHDRALRHVTRPDARTALLAMRPYAPTLTLDGCTTYGGGEYLCTFGHSLAKPSPGHRHGHAEFLVAPAYRHGWYMTVLAACGDGE